MVGAPVGAPVAGSMARSPGGQREVTGFPHWSTTEPSGSLCRAGGVARGVPSSPIATSCPVAGSSQYFSAGGCHGAEELSLHSGGWCMLMGGHSNGGQPYVFGSQSDRYPLVGDPSSPIPKSPGGYNGRTTCPHWSTTIVPYASPDTHWWV